jgi:hypothetical protein
MAEPITTILQYVGSLTDGMQYILLHEQTRRVVLISTKQASQHVLGSFYTARRSYLTVYYIRKASCMSCLLVLCFAGLHLDQVKDSTNLEDPA